MGLLLSEARKDVNAFIQQAYRRAAGDTNAEVRLIHFDDERNTLVYHIGKTTDEQIQHFEKTMTDLNINIKVTGELLTVTPTDTSSLSLALPQEILDLTDIMKNLRVSDISINNDRYKQEQEKEADKAVAAAAGKYASPERKKRETLQRNTLSRASTRIDYANPHFEVEGELDALADLYSTFYFGLSSPDTSEEMEEKLSKAFGPEVGRSIKNTVTMKRVPTASGDGDIVTIITIDIPALKLLADNIDDETGFDIGEQLTKEESLIKVIGSIVNRINRAYNKDHTSSWIFMNSSWDKAVIFQTAADRFYIGRFGIDKTWEAVTPFGGRQKNELRIAPIVE